MAVAKLNIKDINATQLEKLVLQYPISEVAKMYGVTRQYISRVIIRYTKRGLLHEDFPLNYQLGYLNYLDKKSNQRYRLQIITINEKTNKLFYSVDGFTPRWIGIKTNKSESRFFKWSVATDGKVKTYTSHLRDVYIL